MVNNVLSESFCHHRTLHDGSLCWVGCVMHDFVILGKMRSKIKVRARPYMVKNGGGIRDSFLSSSV